MGPRGGAILPLALVAGTQAGAAALLTLDAGGAAFELDRATVAALEISESGGITDVFLRLLPQASGGLDGFAAGVEGELHLGICGARVRGAAVHLEAGSGTIYLANTTAILAEALRALWHGRASCDTLGPEVFGHGD